MIKISTGAHTTVNLLKGVAINNTYRDTIYFDTYKNQYNYFISKNAATFSDNTFQRMTRDTIRVQAKYANIYTCNYMIITNTSYENRHYYCFITSIEYVNEETCEIKYEVDVMQTWHFSYTQLNTFIEREHSVTDNIGDNILPENVETGEYIFNNYESIISMTEMCVCIAIVDTDNATDGTLYDGIYGSAQLWVYDSNDTQAINSKLDGYLQKTEAIISIYMFPKLLIGEIPSSHRLSFSTKALFNNIKLTKLTTNDTLNGYKPKNKKLYTYPYNFYHVDNASGNELNLRYEFFENNTPVMQIGGTITYPVTCILRPCSYKGVANYSELGGYTTLNTESIQLNSYPMCSWNVDSYQAWIAQTAIPSLVGFGLGGLANIATGGVVGGYEGSILSAETTLVNKNTFPNIASLLTNMYKASITADISKGNFNNGNANVSLNKQQFYGGRCSITKQYAIMIDDFFTKYGYAKNEIGIPNRHSRPHWNYVKTVGYQAKGQVPSIYMDKICQIYDNGITFWKNGDEVGDYTLDNTV